MVLATFQGERGAYSEEALFQFFRAKGMRATEAVPCASFEDAVRRVQSSEAHYAFLPLENTLEGTVDEAVDAMMGCDLFIVGEMRYKVEHCLIGHPGATLQGIQTVYSHPYALRQSQDFLRAHKLATVPTNDTAGAVREVKSRGNILEAAIASEKAAQVHGMQILQRGIQSREHNFTRFVALSATEYKPKTTVKERFLTSLVLGVRHSPGALHEALGAFARRNLNLTKLESRPRMDRPWNYTFLVDVEGHREDKELAEALGELVQRTTQLQVLGSYPRWDEAEV